METNNHKDQQQSMAMSDQEIRRYIKIISEQNQAKAVIIRGLINGIFSALGVVLGIIILAVIAVYLLPGLSAIPLIEKFLEVTKIDVIIENQVSRYTGQPGEEVPDQSGDETDQVTDEIKLLEFSDKETKLRFDYPSQFEITATEITESGRIIRFKGSGVLEALDIHINNSPTIVGNKSQKFAFLDSGDRATIMIYDEGVLIEGIAYSDAAFFVQFSYQGNSIEFIGYATEDLPKTAREAFIAIIQTVRFDS